MLPNTPLRSLGLRLLNREQRTGDWSDEACRTFGAPWLDLVLRAGRCRDAIDAMASGAVRGDDDWVPLRRAASAAFDDVGRLASRGQDLHRQMTANGRVPGTTGQAALASFHQRITAMVSEIESCADEAASLELQSLSVDADRVLTTLGGLAERLQLKRDAIAALPSPIG